MPAPWGAVHGLVPGAGGAAGVQNAAWAGPPCGNDHSACITGGRASMFNVALSGRAPGDVVDSVMPTSGYRPCGVARKSTEPELAAVPLLKSSARLFGSRSIRALRFVVLVPL